jgi:hypothetical protein
MSIEQIRAIEKEISSVQLGNTDALVELLRKRNTLLGGDANVLDDRLLHDYYHLKLRLLIFTIDPDELIDGSRDYFENIVSDMYCGSGIHIRPFKVSFIPSNEFGRYWIYPTEYLEL